MAPNPKSGSWFSWLPASWRYELGRLRVHDRFSSSPFAGAASLARSILRPKATVLFYPDKPGRVSMAYKFCALLNYRITNDPRAKVDHRVLSQYATIVTAQPPEGQGSRTSWVNADCRDISKREVDRAFRGVFGYGLNVDPLVHVGPMVEKADANAVKRGRIVYGPLAPDDVREDSVYQIVVDNIEGDEMSELRVPIYDGRIPTVYLLKRTAEDRFGVMTTEARSIAPDEAFDGTERRSLAAFAARMSLEYGELDVLRDKGSGRLYVVDANPTPHGPSRRLSREESHASMATLAAAFAELLERRPRAAPGPHGPSAPMPATAVGSPMQYGDVRRIDTGSRDGGGS